MGTTRVISVGGAEGEVEDLQPNEELSQERNLDMQPGAHRGCGWHWTAGQKVGIGAEYEERTPRIVAAGGGKAWTAFRAQYR